MIFPDGFKKSGIFERNIFKKPLETIYEVFEYEEDNNLQLPEEFK